ncbi:FUSC family protein [Mycobacterium sp. M26]|uniref:FUSC family protein n=1 Tax=Mycobacterium sp. M26 TaxID=1762962 RepID=UPI00073EAF03|nr:FUSC family protein [Mycobacterium sp. M26]
MRWRGGHWLSADAGPALRGLLLVFAAVWVALTWGPVHAAVPVGVATGVLGSTLSDDGAPIRRPVAVVLLSVLTATVIVAVPAAAYPPVRIVVVMVVCLAAAAMWTLGGGAGLVGVGLATVAVSAGAVPATLAATVTTAALVLGFGAAQVLLVPRWRSPGRRCAEMAAAAQYRRVADLARSVLAGAARTDTDAALHGLPHRIATTLQAPGADHRCVSAAVEVLTALGDDRRQAAGPAAEALRRLDATRTPNATAASWRLRGQLHEAVAARFGIEEPLARLHRRTLTVVSREIRWSSPIFRHAVRLAVGVGAALTLISLRPLPEGLWIPLITLMVLRPGCARIYVRSLERIAGLAAGLTIATVITVFWHPIPPVLALLTVAFLAAGWAVQARGAWGTAMVIVAAVATVTQSAGSVADVLGDRLYAAAIGAAIALWMYALLPDPPRAKLYRGITEMLRAQLQYAAVTVRACTGAAVDGTERDAARRRAVAARRAFDSVASATRVTTAATAQLLDAARQEATGLAVAIATLDNAPALPADLLADAADEYATALVGAGVPWRLDSSWLRSAGEGLRLEGSVLAGDDGVAAALTQIEAITRHALALGDMAERVTGHLSYAYAVGDDVH